MSQVNIPTNWHVFSTPSVEPVQCYSILKQKREFLQLIKQNNVQVFNNGHSHYCCIVPNKFGSNLSNEYEIFILFFDESPCSSFIGFQVKACKDTFIHETNLLLLFLKNSSKAICYLMNSNFIHVKCNISDAWELFYHLYDEYLRRYVVTVVGTQFFYSILYSQFIQKEKLFLELLYKGSKVVRISKKSVFYKIHKKRKLSISDLIYTAHNMPKSKKCAFSCFRFKKLPVILKCGKFRYNTARENESDFSKLQKIAKDNTSAGFQLSENMSSPSCSSTDAHIHSAFSIPNSKYNKHDMQIRFSLKRKFEEIGQDTKENISSHNASKCFNSFKLNIGDSVTGEWEKFSDLKPYSIDSYSDIPFIKQLVPSLSDDSNLPNSTNNSVPNVHNVPTQSEMLISTSIGKINAIETALDMKSIHETTNACSQSYCKDLIETPSAKILSKDDEFIIETNKENDNHKSKLSSSNQYISQLSLSDPFSEEFPCTAIPSGSSFETFIDNPCDMIFSTAAGKEIHVSDDALLAARKIMRNVFNEETQTSAITNIHNNEGRDNADSLKDTGGHKTNEVAEKIITDTSSMQSSNKTTFQINNASEQFGMLLDAISNTEDDVGFATAGGKNINVSSNAILEDEKITSNTEDDVGFTTAGGKIINVSSNAVLLAQKITNTAEDDVGFTTAGGRNVNVSSTAMLAAEKILQKIFTDEEKQISEEFNPNSDKIENQPISSAFNHAGCSSKRLLSEEINSMNMNETLVKTCFEDILCDVKELEQAECIENSNVDLEVNISNFPIHKPRKNLGGRKNMKYTEKL